MPGVVYRGHLDASQPALAGMPMSSFAKPLRLVMVGWGAIATVVWDYLQSRGTPVDLVGIAVRDPARHVFPRPVPPLLRHPEELLGVKPDLVLEAAGRDAVASWAPIALRAAPTVILASASALADNNLVQSLTEIAAAHGSRILLPAGALGGIDALAAGAIGHLESVSHTITKPPAAWRGTNAETLVDLKTLTATHTFFEGSARNAAEAFPQNANATVVTSLAGVGLDRTRVVLIADPASSRNRHRIEAAGAFGRFTIELENAPLPANPKSSALTALSLVRLIESQVSSFVV